MMGGGDIVTAALATVGTDQGCSRVRGPTWSSWMSLLLPDSFVLREVLLRDLALALHYTSVEL